jgi:hypothetical protein
LLLPGVDEVERFARGDFVDIRGADFIEERMLFVTEECELPLTGTLGSVAIGYWGTDFWGSVCDDSGGGFSRMVLRFEQL